MKILFNATNNVGGGAVQNAANFIRYAAVDPTHEYSFVVSPQVRDCLARFGISDERVIAADSPARSAAARMYLLATEAEFKPTMVFTMAGPTYVRFGSPHVMGISDPYITHADWLAMRWNRGRLETCLLTGKVLLKALLARVGADYYVFQTESSRAGFCKRYKFDVSRTGILPNAVGREFSEAAERVPGLLTRAVVPSLVLCPSAYYAHKDLEIIERLLDRYQAECLRAGIRFVVTVSNSSPIGRLAASGRFGDVLRNVGPYSYADAPGLYESCALVFMPSILETFSTSYLEAIAFAKPLIVADRSFAREICGNYAHYFPPTDEESAFDVIMKSLNGGSAIDWSERSLILDRYGDQVRRFHAAIEILERAKVSLHA